MVNIPDSSIDPQRERREMENQARQAIQDLNDFILGGASARITLLALDMFQKSLARYERDYEAAPESLEEANRKLHASPFQARLDAFFFPESTR